VPRADPQCVTIRSARTVRTRCGAPVPRQNRAANDIPFLEMTSAETFVFAIDRCLRTLDPRQTAAIRDERVYLSHDERTSLPSTCISRGPADQDFSGIVNIECAEFVYAAIVFFCCLARTERLSTIFTVFDRDRRYGVSFHARAHFEYCTISVPVHSNTIYVFGLIHRLEQSDTYHCPL